LQATQLGGKIPNIDLVVNLSIIFLATVASTFLVAGIVFILHLTKTLNTFSQSVDPLIQKGLKIADNLESISGIIRDDVEEVHASFSGLLDGLRTASFQIEKRIGEFTSLVDLVHREIESALLGLTGVLKFFGRKSRDKQDRSLDSSASSDTAKN
jgi:hypothetical protein